MGYSLINYTGLFRIVTNMEYCSEVFISYPLIVGYSMLIFSHELTRALFRAQCARNRNKKNTNENKQDNEYDE